MRPEQIPKEMSPALSAVGKEKVLEERRWKGDSETEVNRENVECPIDDVQPVVIVCVRFVHQGRRTYSL